MLIKVILIILKKIQSGSCGYKTCDTYNDDCGSSDCGSRTSEVTTNVYAGTVYDIRIFPYSAAAYSQYYYFYLTYTTSETSLLVCFSCFNCFKHQLLKASAQALTTFIVGRNTLVTLTIL